MSSNDLYIFTRYFLPGYKAGGALRSVENTVKCLADSCRLSLFCSDRDLGDSKPYLPSEIASIARANVNVFYFSRSVISLMRYLQFILRIRTGTIYLNSFFDPYFTLIPLLIYRTLLYRRGVMLVLAVRGELSEGSLSLKSQKKRFFLGLMGWLYTHDRVCLQASTEIERIEIQNALMRKRGGVGVERDWRSGNRPATVQVVTDLASVSHTLEELQSRIAESKCEGAALQCVFLSRISPKKNLMYAIEVVSKSSVDTILHIYGPKDDARYYRQCEDAIRELELEDRIEFCGEIFHEDVVDVFTRYDAFLFPTLSENFGHVIFEALSAGLPVVTSDETPWRGLSDKGVGFDLPLGDMEAFVHALDSYRNLTLAQRAQLAAQCWNYASEASEKSVCDAVKSLLLPNRRPLDLGREASEG